MAADFGRLAEWDPNVTGSRLASGDPLRVGATFAVEARFLGRTAHLTYDLIEVDVPRVATYVGRNRFVTSRDTVRVSPNDSGALIEFEAEVAFHGAGNLLRPVFRIVSARMARAALDGLVGALE